MQELQELMPDEETFRRVWRRVMPNEAASPIAVHPPGAGPRHPAKPQRPQTQPQRPPQPEQQEQRGDALRQILETLDESLAAASAVVRRRPGARPLWESVQKSAAQARSAWFLRSGQRWAGKSRPVSGNTPLGSLLREQYIREMEISRLCRDGARQAEELEEIAPGLEEASRRRREMIRNLLTRM